MDRRREGSRTRDRRGEHIAATLTPPLVRLFSACASARRGEREGRRIKPRSLCTLFALYFRPFLFFLISIIQGMKAGVSWHGSIKERDALNAASLSTRGKEEEVGDNTERGQKQDF